MDAYCCFAFSCRPTCTSLYLPEPVYEALLPRQILSVKCEVMVHERQKQNALFRSA